jgi:hypothetical protein
MRKPPPGTWIKSTGGSTPGEPDPDGKYSGNQQFGILPDSQTQFIIRWRGGAPAPPPRLQSTVGGYAVYNPQPTVMEVRLHRADAEAITLPPGGYWQLGPDVSEYMDTPRP